VRVPELPEVEVTRRRIAPLLVGRRIAKVFTTRQSYFFLTKPARLERELPGRTVRALERRGKYLLCELDDGRRLLLHLGMSGQLFAESATSVRLLSAATRAALSPEAQRAFVPDRHTHLRIEFDDGGAALFFRDVRKFGKVRLLGVGESDARLDRLGVDALAATGDELFAAVRRRKVAIKSLLLAQSVIAGIGNIYADEALFLAGIRPRRAAGRLSKAECHTLVSAVQKVLLRSIETGGSSISDYVLPDGSDGAYQDERRVYARTGEPCFVCGTPIRRTVIGARGTHFCPVCQR
jgi:formamidopyrimidine-DNA glycosylase